MKIQKETNLEKQSIKFTLEATAKEIQEVVRAIAPEVIYDPNNGLDIVPDEMVMRVLWYYLNRSNKKNAK